MSSLSRFGVSMALLALIGGGCVGGRQFGIPSSNPNEESLVIVNEMYSAPVEYRGMKYLVRPTDMVAIGSSEKEIPPLDNPKFVSISDAKNENYLIDDLDGIVIYDGGKMLFFPEQILAWHEIVNFDIANEPVSVTFSPLTETAVAYSRALYSGEIVSLKRSGYAWNNNTVLYSQETRTFWLQANGLAIAGKNKVGESLSALNASIMTFGEFEKKYPDGQVLSSKTGLVRKYDVSPYGVYRESKAIYFPMASSPVKALNGKTFVYGVDVNGVYKAYEPELLKATTRGVKQDTIDDTDIVVWMGEDGVVHANERGDVKFTYPAKGGLKDNLGYVWMVDKAFGDLVLGEKRLNVVPTLKTFWFFWSAFHPDTELFANVRGKGLVDGVIELKEKEGSEESDSVKIDVDPSKFPSEKSKIEVETK